MRNWEHSLGEKVQKSVQNCVISVQKSYFFTKIFWGQAPRLPPDPQLERGIAPPQTLPIRSSNYPPTFQQAPTPLELWHFQHFPIYGDRPPSRKCKILLFGHAIIIDFGICCCARIFIIGSRFRPPASITVKMFNARLLGNGVAMATASWQTSGTWWDATTEVSSKSVHWQESYGISNIFQHRYRPHFKF